MLCALIMAGGKGTRFWPLSTEEKPKQFLNLIGKDTMIQMTVNRIKDIIPIERIFICTCINYVELVREQLPDIPQRNIIIEPEGRNTAPCIALSSFIIENYYPNSNVLVLPSDHLIKSEGKFRKLVLLGNEYLYENKNAIITLGIKPTRAETGYGYIKINDKYVKKDSRILKVENFVEKPDIKKANEYINDNRYFWNSGIFIWNVESILNKIEEFEKDTYNALKNIFKSKNIQLFINENYKYTNEISIDYAILERSNEIYVIPSDIDWDDIGTWRAVERYRQKDKFNNIKDRNLITINSKSNMAINTSKKIIMIGVEDIMTVETENTVFIVNKDYMDELKEYRRVFDKINV